MGTWDEVRKEILAESRDESTGESAPDVVRRRKIQRVEEITETPLVVYAVSFIDDSKAARVGAGLQIDLADKTGFNQATSDVPPGPLDVLLHSPGGSPTATESLVHQLRADYSPIRFIVPHTAKSAATMLALSGNTTLLGPNAELGPIDPQLRFAHDGRVVTVPAQAALDQFAYAYQEIHGDASKVAVWMPILRQFGPSFLQECRNSIQLSQQFVSEWLSAYMFGGEPDAEVRAARVAYWLADHNNFKSHSRRIGIDELLAIEPSLKVGKLNDQPNGLADAVMDVYWAIEATFDQTDAFKIIEHKRNSAYVRLARTVQVVQGQPPSGNSPAPIPPSSNRAERRRGKFGR